MATWSNMTGNEIVLINLESKYQNVLQGDIS